MVWTRVISEQSRIQMKSQRHIHRKYHRIEKYIGIIFEVRMELVMPSVDGRRQPSPKATV